MKTENLKTTATAEREIELYSTDYVFMDKCDCFVRFASGQVFITADDGEVEEEIECGSTPIRCTDLSQEKQAELIENIKQFNR